MVRESKEVSYIEVEIFRTNSNVGIEEALRGCCEFLKRKNYELMYAYKIPIIYKGIKYNELLHTIYDIVEIEKPKGLEYGIQDSDIIKLDWNYFFYYNNDFKKISI